MAAVWHGPAGPVGAAGLGSQPAGVRQPVLARAGAFGGRDGGPGGFVDGRDRIGGPTSFLLRGLHCGTFAATRVGP